MEDGIVRQFAINGLLRLPWNYVAVITAGRELLGNIDFHAASPSSPNSAGAGENSIDVWVVADLAADLLGRVSVTEAETVSVETGTAFGPWPTTRRTS
jgi:hypothetical protein